MCGISGSVDFNQGPASSKIIEKMNLSLHHRGPDASGVWCYENVGLGHTRLKVIDLSDHSSQPMVTENSEAVLTYNGELYNFKEIRAELRALGVQFQSSGDTEVVLNALRTWGVNALQKFNGMFAFAYFEKRSGTLIMARDRYGIKPLYYARQNNQLWFASEHKAIIDLPSFNKQIDRYGLLEYLTFQNILSDKTLLKDIETLPPGHYISVNVKDKKGAQIVRQYWDFDFSSTHSEASPTEYYEELTRLVKQAVNRQLVSDVEMGTYLSGGIDSGLIASIASQSVPYMKSFTCGFDLSSASGLEQALDERVAAERMSYLFRTEHYEMVLKAGDMERSIERLSYHLEEPRAGQCYPNYYAAQLASKFVTVCLSGVGGDELFGGYPWRYEQILDSQTSEEFNTNYYKIWNRLLPSDYKQKFIAPLNIKDAEQYTKGIFDSVIANDQGEQNEDQWTNRALYFDAKTFLKGLLHVEDRLSMAHGLEARVPFLDNDLVDFAMQRPNWGRKECRSVSLFGQTLLGKGRLRTVAAKLLPESIVTAKKQGFTAPDSSWFKGESIEYVKQQLFKQHSPIMELIDKKVMQQLVQQHLDGKVNHRLFIWSMLSLQHWYNNTFN